METIRIESVTETKKIKLIKNMEASFMVALVQTYKDGQEQLLNSWWYTTLRGAERKRNSLVKKYT